MVDAGASGLVGWSVKSVFCSLNSLLSAHVRVLVAVVVAVKVGEERRGGGGEGFPCFFFGVSDT